MTTAFNRISRTIVLVSAGLALVTELRFSVGPLAHHVIAAGFVAALVGGSLIPSVTQPAVLLGIGVAPGLLKAWLDLPEAVGGSAVNAAMAGFVLARSARRREWSLPAPWCTWVVLWAMCVAVVWPIIIGREADFALSNVDNDHLGVTGRGLTPPREAFWIAHVAVMQLVGLLWFDLLSSLFTRSDVRLFERTVVWPLAIGTAISIAFGAYQTVHNPLWFNPSIYGVLGRAGGLVLDGNVFGILSAMWIAGFTALALRHRGVLRQLLLAAALAAAVTVWGSGSRTALLAASCSVMGLLAVAVMSIATLRLQSRQLAAILVIGAVAAVAAGRYMAASGPIDRISYVLDRSRANGVGVATYLWNRDGYGTSAMKMIADSPAVGVGIGTFHTLVLDYSREPNPTFGLKFDNAQNWWRHELAEFGLIGSLGLLGVSVLVVRLLFGRSFADNSAVWIISAGLVGVGLASLVGMPTQNVIAFMTFWVFVAWLQTLRAPAMLRQQLMTLRQSAGIVIALILFAGGTIRAARYDLRVPERAVRFRWPYSYGFSQVQNGADAYRRTTSRAVDVFNAPNAFVKLTFWAEHPDVDSQPVNVEIWRGRERIANVSLNSRQPVTWYIRRNPDAEWMLLEFRVNRTWSDAHYGLSLAPWEFVDVPAPGIPLIN